MGAGAARLLLPGGPLGVAVVVLAVGGRDPRPARAPSGGGQVGVGAELCGFADARAACEAPPQHPGAAALRQLRLVGLRHQPGLAAFGPSAAALLPGRERRLSAGPGVGSLLSDQGSASPSSAGQRRGRKSACDTTPAEVQLRFAGRERRQLLWQWQDVPPTVVALYFQRADDSLGLGLKAVV